MPEVSVVTVTWNSATVIDACLGAVLDREAPADVEVIAVDNASGDGTVEKLAGFDRRIRLIRNSINRGYARAVNQGIRASRGEIIVLLNPDTVPEPGSLDELTRYIAGRARVGLAGGELLNRDGSRQESVRGFPDYLNLAFRPTSPLTRLLSAVRPAATASDPGPRSPGPVESVAGTFLAIRRRMLAETGLFDENYFMYVEDMDLCYRARRAGWEVHYLPGVRAYHLWGDSTRLNRRRMAAEHARGMYRFMVKHRRPAIGARIFLVLGLGFYGLAGAVGRGPRGK